MILRWRRHRYREESEMNITAFMNLMVILVPFLLITATFSQISILGIELPASGATVTNDKQPDLDLRIVVRSGQLLVLDGERLLARLDNSDTGHDLSALDAQLTKLKQRFPAIRQAQLLAEIAIPYEEIIAIMDQLRSGATGQERFPLISLGNAPAATETEQP